MSGTCAGKVRTVAVLVMLAAGVASAGEFKVGFARTDITPPLGVNVPGYFVQRTARTILDPLQVNCLAFADGSSTALVFQVDDLHICDALITRFAAAVCEATGIPRELVYIHSSHTHTGGNLTNPALDDVNAVYRDLVTRRIADAAVLAAGDLKPATLSFGRSVAHRISFGRRYRMKDGKVRTNPGVGNPDIVAPAGTPPDEEVQVLRIDRTGGEPICVINFQTHPDVIGGDVISADWPGLTRHVFEAATFGRTRCLVLNGAQGDVNHVNVQPRPGEDNGLHRDFDDVDRGYGHAQHMANVLSAAALGVWAKCVPLRSGPVRGRCVDVRVPSQRAKTEREITWAREVMAKYGAGRFDELPWKGMELTTELARARRILRLENGPDFFDLPISSIAIGDELVFVGFPGEPFNDIGKAVKKGSPFRLTLVSCLTNASRGYFPFSDSFVGGGYEAATSSFGPTVADDLVAGALNLVKELK